MKKLLFSLIIISLIIFPSYAINIFGVNFPSSKYGGSIAIVPLYLYNFFNLSGYFEIGLPIKGVEGLYVMAGPRATYAFWTGYVINGSYFSIGMNVDAIYLLKQWSFKLFGLTWYPSLNGSLSIDFVRLGNYYESPYVNFNLYLGLYSPYGKENSYMNVYFWPWPIFLGFNMVNF